MGEVTQGTVPEHLGLKVSRRVFERLCRANPDLRLGRMARGELWVLPPAGSDSGRRNASLTARLWNWNRAFGLGVAFDSSSGFTLPNGVIHAPDASWIARERWEALDPSQRTTFAPICPDFVAELRSPSDKLILLRSRILEFINQGTRLGWLLDAKNQVVEIYRPGQPVEKRKRPATLDGEEVLPGFVLDLNGVLFD
ncbi:MAG: Uma2 family endonuclease [Isosphaeraceae bacterium]|nr:Uma2 family endonuclease [Isosphaeraceae bacterium]